MNISQLKRGCELYSLNEKRGIYYELALEIKDNYPLHASVLLLATWNIGRFRFVKEHNEVVAKIKETIKVIEPYILRTTPFTIQTADLIKLKEFIYFIYQSLSAIEGVKFTGASKLMSIFNDELFVMWDDKIRKAYRIRKNACSDYLQFLMLMQEEVKTISWSDPQKTLAKAIDEYNYSKYTLSEEF